MNFKIYGKLGNTQVASSLLKPQSRKFSQVIEQLTKAVNVEINEIKTASCVQSNLTTIFSKNYLENIQIPDLKEEFEVLERCEKMRKKYNMPSLKKK